MAVILHIETSTNVCSVAVSENGQCIFEQSERGGMNHAEKLGTMVDEALSFTDNHAIPFDAVAVSCGPGSYTGVRVACTVAKTFAYSKKIKLFSFSSLDLLYTTHLGERNDWR